MKRSHDHSPINDKKKPRFGGGILSYNIPFTSMAPGMGIGADSYVSYSQKGILMAGATAGVGIPGVGLGLASMGMTSGLQQQQYPMAAYQAALGGSYFGAAAAGTPAIGVPGQQSDGSGAVAAAAYTQNQYAAVAAAVAAQQIAASSIQGGRAIYVGNIPPEITVSRLLDHVKCGGPLENVRFLPEKSCAFLYFLDNQTAAMFYQEWQHKKFTVDGHELRVGWGKAPSTPSMSLADAEAGATRNVYLGHLDESFTEERIRDDLSRFGPVEHVRVIRDKNFGFVHFLSIQNAVKCVAALQTDPNYLGRRVHYGKDRCAVYQLGRTPTSRSAFGPSAFQNPMGFTGTFAPGQDFQISDATGSMATFPISALDMAAAGNRSIYLGGIHPDATCEDICNAIRGGILNQIRYISDKHIAFVTFVDPTAAVGFYNTCAFQGLVVKSRRVRVGWGKAAIVPRDVLAAVQVGASRNVYLGGIEDNVSEDQLRADFSAYGEIELVNILREKSCGFVNFTTISAAIKAVEGMRGNSTYAGVKINFGKDRCGNPPRPPRVRDGETGLLAGGCLSAPGTVGTTTGMLGFGVFPSPAAPPPPGVLSPPAGPPGVDVGPPGTLGTAGATEGGGISGQMSALAGAGSAGIRVTSPVSFFA